MSIDSCADHSLARSHTDQACVDGLGIAALSLGSKVQATATVQEGDGRSAFENRPDTQVDRI